MMQSEQGSRRVRREGKALPLVSVIIPTYNRGWTVGKTIRSVYAQVYRPIECVVVDDGSTDDTPDILRELAANAPEGITLRCITKRNEGSNSARNFGLRVCAGDLICFVDSDDRLTPESILLRVAALQASPDCDLCYGLVSLQDEQGCELRRLGSPWPAQGEARIAAYLFCTPAPLITRQLSDRVGLWWPADTNGQEHEYFARLKYFARNVAFTDQVVAIYVRHGRDHLFNEESVDFLLATLKVTLSVKALVLYGDHDCSAERRRLAAGFRTLGRKLFRAGDWAHAAAALGESLSLNCSWKALAIWCALKPISLIRSAARQIRVPGH